ncbi:hypothetical protein WJX84_002886 [Apatococcus fuscideae]|uniref:ATP citrate synthase n=1 Tax=Apatococcus fuscideae TaxID=2026836 RepID=A0AAW1RWW3_9CHLO
MARKKIREYDSKRLLKEHIKRLYGIDLPLSVVHITPSTNFSELRETNAWLVNTKLVVKPDMLFGKRGKHDLVGLNLDFSGAEEFVRARMNKRITMDKCSGEISTFIIEPFVPHDQEFYLSVQSERLGNVISFSEAGGVEIEENWDKVKTVTLNTMQELTEGKLAPILGSLSMELRKKMEQFIQAVYGVFMDLDFSLIEMNPFALDKDGRPFPLDMRGELDDTAAFKSGKKWGDLDFPLPFGRSMTSSEEYVHEMDGKTGASLKLSILNPKGRIWTMVAGGGASVIYADTVGDLGLAEELGNYAEYSGAPNTAETYAYAKTLLECATANPDGRPRALLVGGGIANFTDVAATFKGIIKAMQEKAHNIKAARMKILVRRGGPNYQAGLDLMRKLDACKDASVVAFCFRIKFSSCVSGSTIVIS